MPIHRYLKWHQEIESIAKLGVSWHNSHNGGNEMRQRMLGRGYSDLSGEDQREIGNLLFCMMLVVIINFLSFGS